MKPVRTIDEISTEIASGIACAKSQAVADGVLHLRPFSVTNDGRLVTADAPRIPHSIVPSNRMNFQEGDILFNNTNSVELVGKSAVVSTALEASFSNHMTRVRIDRRAAEPGYVQAFLCHLYRRRFFQDRATRWVGQAAFGTAQLKALEIPLPLLDEQRRIVELLDRAAEIRRRAEAARAKARTIIPALFLDTFGDPATNPKGWRIASLKEAADISYGSAAKLNTLLGRGDGRRIITISNVLIDGMIDRRVERYYPASAEEIQKYSIQTSDMLFNWRNGSADHIGKTALVTPDLNGCLHVSFLLKIRTKRNIIDPRYLWTKLNLLRAHGYFKQNSREQINRKFNASELAELQIAVPPLDVQTQFADRLREIETLTGGLDAAAIKAAALLAALSAEVFDASRTKGQGYDSATAGQ